MSASKYVDVGVSDFTLFEGTKYTVTWDGKKYESTCESDYGILHIGNFALYDIAPFSKTDTGEPFCVIYDGNTNQIIGEKSGASHQIVMLYGIPTVHMLSPAYIGVQSKSNYMSDDSGRVQYLATPDGNYELVVPEIPNIKNALNGLSEKRIATFEMTAEQLDAVSSNEYTEIKTNANIAVSGYNPNNLQSYYVDLLVGGKRYKVLPIDDDTSTANFVFETEQFGLPVRTYCIRIENRSYKQKIIRLDQNALNEKKFIFKQQAVADAGKVLTVGDDGKVVPKEGAGGSDLSLGLTSAQVGQIIKVKAVDENGKPTQWETANDGENWEKVADVTVTETVKVIRVTFDACSVVYVQLQYGGVEDDLGKIGIHPNQGETPYTNEKRSAAAVTETSNTNKHGYLFVTIDTRKGDKWTAASDTNNRGDGTFGEITPDALMNCEIGINNKRSFSLISNYYFSNRNESVENGVKSITAYGAGMAKGTTMRVWGIKK